MAQESNSPWQYKPDDGKASPGSSKPADEPGATAKRRSLETVSWQASEYIEHKHGAGWYSLLVLTTLVLSAIVYLITGHDYVATAIMLIVGIIVGVYAKHKPELVQYEISDSGLKVGSKTYQYSDFKSFSVVNEGALRSVNLFPLKRLVPPVSAYFDPADEKKIIDALGNYLPYEKRDMDSIDRLSRRLRL